MRHVLIALLALALPCLIALAQNDPKSVIKRQLGGAVNERNEQLDQATDNPKPPTETAKLPPGTPLPIKSGWITRTIKVPAASAEIKVRLYFSRPEIPTNAKPNLPALIVIQEWWGLNDDIQQRTREFAQHGFYALAVDLYDGQATDDPAKAKELHDKITDDGCLLRLKTGVDLLEEEVTNGVVDPKRIASIGWCMGGQQSLLLSLADQRIRATVIFYGGLVTDSEKLKNLQGPVLGVFGNNDKGPSPASVNAFEDGLKKAGVKDVTIYRYDGVGHAFASKAATKLGLYNEEKAKDAWAKTYAWLTEKLLKPS